MRANCNFLIFYVGDLGDVVQRRTAEVSNFLQMLRSSLGNKSEATMTHGISHSDWKVCSLLLCVSIYMYNMCEAFP